jgi:hypothetical protein
LGEREHRLRRAGVTDADVELLAGDPGARAPLGHVLRVGRRVLADEALEQGGTMVERGRDQPRPFAYEDALRVARVVIA